jgi:putative transposase
LKESLQERIRQAALVGVKTCLEAALCQELNEHLGFAPYERHGEGTKPAEQQRSGYYKRKVETGHGEIADLCVPKLRRGNKARIWQVLTRYQRCLQRVLDGLLYLYVMGLSLRDLQEALCVMYGSMLSVSAINQVTLQIHDQVKAWQASKLTETPPIVIVDGVWVKILYPTGTLWTDKAGHQRQQSHGEERVVLAAMAVWPDGRYSLLHYEVAQREETASWQTFWQHLLARGLVAKEVQLVVSDGSKGLQPALSTHLPNANVQRCTVHKVRGFERYLGYQHLPAPDPQTQPSLTQRDAKAQRKSEIAQDALDIFQAPCRDQAEERLAQFIDKWQSLEPKAVHAFTRNIDQCLLFYAFEPHLRTLIHSTNVLERFFREFRAKSDEIGSFPNETSCLTIFHLVMLRDHAKHQRSKVAKNS